MLESLSGFWSLIEFVRPGYLWMLLLLPLYAIWEIQRHRKWRVRLPHPEVEVLREVTGGGSRLWIVPLVLRLLVILFIVLALGRPRLAFQRERLISDFSEEELRQRGIDIMLAIDVSYSMAAVDFQPSNRLEAAKKVAREFIANRPVDRIGMVVFSGFAYTQCPLTTSHELLNHFINQVDLDESRKGTAIGVGLSMAVARLRNSDAKEKVVILITDGRNNTGEIPPNDAAEMAKLYGIKVYPIGIGQKGQVDFPVVDPLSGRTYYRKVSSDLDMDTLNRIARVTGTGRAWRARNTEELANIIRRIDEKERVELKTEKYFEYHEIFSWLIWIATLGMIVDLIFRIRSVRGIV